MSFYEYQNNVVEWMRQCFGPDSATKADTLNRGHRFLEEALELVQAVGVDKKDALALIDYVYARPVGEAEQEIGGVMVTLAGLSESIGQSFQYAAGRELRRVNHKMQEIRAKELTRSQNSALPGVSV